jgi:predicted nucleotidyltransferase
MKKKFGLSPETIEKLRKVFFNHPEIKKIIIYGSRAKGNYKDGSDIDITLVAPDLNFSDLLNIENELDDLMLPYKIDLSLFHLIENQQVIEHISRVGKILLENGGENGDEAQV